MSMILIKIIKKIAVLSLSGLLLMACSAKKPAISTDIAPIPPSPPTVEQLRAGYRLQLDQKQVQVIEIGESVRIILQSDNLFVPHSANLIKNNKAVLHTVSEFMNTYEMKTVQVAAYVDSRMEQPFAKTLSTQQARVVSHVLWREGVDTRLMYAVGYNHLDPVDWNGSEKGRRANRRIEINFFYYR